jgi:DNA-directed RNA polymerase specialized sigma24 family protein
MQEKANTANDGVVPRSSVPQDAQESTARVHGLPDGQPKDGAKVKEALGSFEEMFQLIAAGMYSTASMLVGEGEDSIRLVEAAVANADLSASHSHAEERQASRLALCAAALDMLTARDASGLAAPLGLAHATTCIEDDDLDAAGVSGQEFERLIGGPDRDRVRTWLESLPTGMRTIFVLRAVAGFSTVDTAALLRRHGGPQAAGWDADAVRELFRQGLCSLASQVLHAANQ